jgi:hypothetical protein
MWGIMEAADEVDMSGRTADLDLISRGKTTANFTWPLDFF